MDRIDGNPNPLDFASGSAVPVAQDAPPLCETMGPIDDGDESK